VVDRREAKRCAGSVIRRSRKPAFKALDICYDPTLITKPKTFHIKTISAIFHAPSISLTLGKLVHIGLHP
jgi:hypothetical protein